MGVPWLLRKTHEGDFGGHCLGLIEAISWREEGRGCIRPRYPKAPDNSPGTYKSSMIVGSGKRKQRNSEKEVEANKGVKGQRIEPCED